MIKKAILFGLFLFVCSCGKKNQEEQPQNNNISNVDDLNTVKNTADSNIKLAKEKISDSASSLFLKEFSVLRSTRKTEIENKINALENLLRTSSDISVIKTNSDDLLNEVKEAESLEQAILLANKEIDESNKVCSNNDLTIDDCVNFADINNAKNEIKTLSAELKEHLKDKTAVEITTLTNNLSNKRTGIPPTHVINSMNGAKDYANQIIASANSLNNTVTNAGKKQVEDDINDLKTTHVTTLTNAINDCDSEDSDKVKTLNEASNLLKTQIEKINELTNNIAQAKLNAQAKISEASSLDADKEADNLDKDTYLNAVNAAKANKLQDALVDESTTLQQIIDMTSELDILIKNVNKLIVDASLQTAKNLCLEAAKDNSVNHQVILAAEKLLQDNDSDDKCPQVARNLFKAAIDKVSAARQAANDLENKSLEEVANLNQALTDAISELAKATESFNHALATKKAATDLDAAKNLCLESAKDNAANHQAILTAENLLNNNNSDEKCAKVSREAFAVAIDNANKAKAAVNSLEDKSLEEVNNLNQYLTDAISELAKATESFNHALLLKKRTEFLESAKDNAANHQAILAAGKLLQDNDSDDKCSQEARNLFKAAIDKASAARQAASNLEDKSLEEVNNLNQSLTDAINELAKATESFNQAVKLTQNPLLDVSL